MGLGTFHRIELLMLAGGSYAAGRFSGACMMNISKMEALTRLGFAARGVIYFLIGYLALRTGRAEDGSGILEYLNSGSGKLLLGIMALGLLAYGLWRLSEAAIDSEGHGKDAKGLSIRLGGAISGLIHLALGFYAASLSLGRGSGGSGSGGAQESTQTALSLPGGQVVVSLVAAGLILTGLLQLIKAIRADFLKHLDREAAAKEWVKVTGRAGYAARGVVFLIMGWFFWQSAQKADAAEAGGMDAALASLPPTPQLIVAGGLLLFGVFSMVEAVYRRITDPHVLDRLGGLARSATPGR